MFNNTEPTNLNPKPYGWYPYSTKSGMHVGFMKKDELILLHFLKEGLPLKEAWEYKKTQPGIKNALNGIVGPFGPDLIDQVNRTKKFIENPYILQFETPLKLEEIHKFDVLDLETTGMIFCTQKVINIFNDFNCDFEAFPISIQAKDGVSIQYYVLNITHLLMNTINYEKSRYKLDEDCELGDKDSLDMYTWSLNENPFKGKHLGRIYEVPSRILMSEDLANALKNAGVMKYYIPFEEQANRWS
tara:strand:- start:398 stop:1129 length:732 start_codon:yes stop_codon:yes gene_type:complete